MTVPSHGRDPSQRLVEIGAMSMHVRENGRGQEEELEEIQCGFELQ